jgi:rfaE bifunctional protein nucleotidyltransferase chain/domain
VVELWLRSPVRGEPKVNRLGQVVSQGELDQYRGEWKRAHKVVVCAVGTFDLLHPGHVRLLEQARSLGDVLVVALWGDRLTPGSCSIIPAAERAEVLAALRAVDYVVELDPPSPRKFLARLLPDLFVEGSGQAVERSDFPSGSKASIEEIETLGCKVVRIPPEPGHSTARLIRRILEIPA